MNELICGSRIPPIIIYHPDDGDMTEVGSYPNGDSPYGALNIAGNVREWVGNWYSDTYYVSSPTSNSSRPNEGENRVTRGREWAQGPRDVRAASRYNQPPKHTTGDLAVGLEIVETLLHLAARYTILCTSLRILGSILGGNAFIDKQLIRESEGPPNEQRTEDMSRI
jgi:hypothetical protein